MSKRDAAAGKDAGKVVEHQGFDLDGVRVGSGQQVVRTAANSNHRLGPLANLSKVTGVEIRHQGCDLRQLRHVLGHASVPQYVVALDAQTIQS